MKERIGVVLVGAGRIGALHARNIVTRVPELELRAVVEPAPAPEFGEWISGIKIPLFDEVDAALTVTDSDAVLVAVPTDAHVAVASRAIAQGLHVFCEKPLAPDIPAARSMIDAAKSAGVVLQVGFNRRFDHNFAALRRAVDDGRIGRIELIRVTSRDPAPPGIDYIRRSGGLFVDMTIHDFDMARFLSGDEFVEVFATGASLVDHEIGEVGDIDTAVISFRMQGGAIGYIENSRRAAYGYDQRAELLGSAGSVASANDTLSTVVVSDAEGVHGERPLYFFLERYDESFVAELVSFARAVRAGDTPAVTGNDGLEAMRIAAACGVSLREHRPVRLDEID